MQQSTAGLINVVVNVGQQFERSARLADVATWISLHPGLINSINIKGGRSGQNQDIKSRVIRRYLEFGLQLAAAGGGRPAAAQTASTPAQQLWRLQSYSSEVIISPAILAALPAASLTSLKLNSRHAAELGGLAAPLARLTGLQELQLRITTRNKPISPQNIAAIGRLSRLTSLNIQGVQEIQSLQQLPTQLQELTVLVGSGRLDLGHLVCLHSLELWSKGLLAAGSILPPYLECLLLHSNTGDAPIANLSIASLQQLRCLRVYGPVLDAHQLQSLVAMSELQQLDLYCQNLEAATATAEVWPQLPMLCDLGLKCCSSEVQDLEAVCAAAIYATGITRLALDLRSPEKFEDAMHDPAAGAAAAVVPLEYGVVHACEHLTGLVGLQELDINVSGLTFGCLADRDALYLSSLTNLTSLYMRGSGGVDDTVLCALAVKLTELHNLVLYNCNYILTAAPLPALGELTKLHLLYLSPYEAANAEVGLKFLTGLHQLRHLDGFDAASDEALQAFWAAVHGGNT